jgi:hypothetical protein
MWLLLEPVEEAYKVCKIRPCVDQVLEPPNDAPVLRGMHLWCGYLLPHL